jgi:hypothetical protein
MNVIQVSRWIIWKKHDNVYFKDIPYVMTSLSAFDYENEV